METTTHIINLKAFIFSQLEDNNLLPPALEHKNYDKVLFQSPYSLRLRKTGYILLKALYDHERFELKEKLTGRELMTLKNDVGWPYYLPVDHSYIVLFTIRESFLLKLQGGNVKKWLSQIYEKNSKKNKDL